MPEHENNQIINDYPSLLQWWDFPSNSYKLLLCDFRTFLFLPAATIPFSFFKAVVLKNYQLQKSGFEQYIYNSFLLPYTSWVREFFNDFDPKLSLTYWHLAATLTISFHNGIPKRHWYLPKYSFTRMHSSRMRTTRLRIDSSAHMQGVRGGGRSMTFPSWGWWWSCLGGVVFLSGGGGGWSCPVGGEMVLSGGVDVPSPLDRTTALLTMWPIPWCIFHTYPQLDRMSDTRLWKHNLRYTCS